MNSVNDVIIFGNLLGLAVIVIWLSGFLVIFIGLLLSRVYEKRFYNSVIEILASKNYSLETNIDSIKNEYEVYRRHRFGFAGKSIVSICQESASSLRRGIKLDSIQCNQKDEWANGLEKIIKQLKYEQQFDDEKANEIINELYDKIDDKSIEKVKQRLVFLEAYHKGVLSVKNLELQDLKEKMNRKQWISWVSGIVGVIGGLISIISIF